VSRSRIQKNKKHFDGTIEKRRAPKIHSGEHMFMMVNDLKVILGKRK
jgi:ribosome-associated protein YbcJ (S4-like RNA binding protein)